MTHDPNDLGFDRFPHHQLDAYGVALEALCAADVIAKRLPRGNGPLCDQLRRASQSAFLQLAEGAARSGADRAQRLQCARAAGVRGGPRAPRRRVRGRAPVGGASVADTADLPSASA
ncbi:MAG: hypothetical protein IPG04_05195, partial [Polyangiaceae bacterium]|nr:hypothetical protein [Polyangiaceae bacterium]